MQSIAKVLGDRFNPTFSESSYGYRPGRSVQQAARQAQSYYQQGYTIQIDIDSEKFFDTVNHDVLMVRVARKVKNKGLLKLLGSFLRAGVVVEGRLQPTKVGVPQGSPVSPILSNILLDYQWRSRCRNTVDSLTFAILVRILLPPTVNYNEESELDRLSKSLKCIFEPGTCSKSETPYLSTTRLRLFSMSTRYQSKKTWIQRNIKYL